MNEIVAGTLSGFVIVIIIIAFTALIFKGPLAVYFPIGVICALIGAVIVNFITAASSSFAFSIARPEPSAGAILAIICANIADQPMSAVALVSTLFTTIILVTILVGITMLFIGHFNFGQLARFLPYPVLGGVIMGSAWIMARSSLSLMDNSHLNFHNMFDKINLLQLSIAVSFALSLLFILKNTTRLWMTPIVILMVALMINALLYLNHISHTEAIQSGWFFSSYTPAFTFSSINLSLVTQIHWSVIFNQAGYIASLIGLIIIMLILNVSALESLNKNNADFDHELKIAGIGNLLAGVCGGASSILSLSGTLLNRSLGATSSISSLIAGFTCATILLVFPKAISYLPIPLVTGVLLFTSGKLMIEWLYYGWFKLPFTDYLTIILILVIIAFWNFLPGVLIGILITCINFVITYAKVDAIKYSTSGQYYHSNVIRTIYEQKWLSQSRYKIMIFKLQGYLFFGSTKVLLDQLKKIVDEEENAEQWEFLILDFQLVTGLDTSGSFNFIRLQQLLPKNQLTLVFSNCSKNVLAYFNQQNVLHKNSSILLFPDLDQGLEWCEQQLLQAMPDELKIRGSSITDSLNQLITNEEQRMLFLGYLERFDLKINDYLMRQGEYSDSLYFIETGTISVLLEKNKGTIRLSKSGPGTIIGEIGFYLNKFRTASVRAETNCVIYKLTHQALIKLEQEHPAVALVFHKNIIYTLARRLIQTTYLAQH